MDEIETLGRRRVDSCSDLRGLRPIIGDIGRGRTRAGAKPLAGGHGDVTVLFEMVFFVLDGSRALDEELDIHLSAVTFGGVVGGPELHSADRGVVLDFVWDIEFLWPRTLVKQSRKSVKCGYMCLAWN